MIEYPIRKIHNISRPGEPPRPNDEVEVETPNGYMREIDPVTRKATDKPKRFVVVR